ncbi:GNAT family N-acetyltransferase [Prosthecomicrobium sp. N25]|uniref:GNAT family N-acetyltransferase n=1 Tax=Prosthecomicrobium sp. N25 TaxID=3129254 RepID=UPI003076E628
MTAALVRPFARDDLEPSMDIWAAAWTAALPDRDMASSLPAWRTQFIQELLPARTVLAGTVGGRLAGFAVVDLKRGWLDMLCVDPAVHGAGLGRLLLDTACALAEDDLRFRVLKDNESAIGFYEHLGCERESEGTAPVSGWACWHYVRRRAPRA